jgi:cytochrome P450
MKIFFFVKTGRKLEQDMTIDGLDMTKGSTAIVFVHMLHRNPTVWDNPEKYDPERFLDQG